MSNIATTLSPPNQEEYNDNELLSTIKEEVGIVNAEILSIDKAALTTIQIKLSTLFPTTETLITQIGPDFAQYSGYIDGLKYIIPVLLSLSADKEPPPQIKTQLSILVIKHLTYIAMELLYTEFYELNLEDNHKRYIAKEIGTLTKNIHIQIIEGAKSKALAIDKFSLVIKDLISKKITELSEKIPSVFDSSYEASIGDKKIPDSKASTSTPTTTPSQSTSIIESKAATTSPTPSSPAVKSPDLLERANRGDPDAQYEVASFLETQGAELKSAIEYYTKAAASNHFKSVSRLIEIYRSKTLGCENKTEAERYENMLYPLPHTTFSIHRDSISRSMGDVQDTTLAPYSHNTESTPPSFATNSASLNSHADLPQRIMTPPPSVIVPSSGIAPRDSSIQYAPAGYSGNNSLDSTRSISISSSNNAAQIATTSSLSSSGTGRRQRQPLYNSVTSFAAAQTLSSAMSDTPHTTSASTESSLSATNSASLNSHADIPQRIMTPSPSLSDIGGMQSPQLNSGSSFAGANILASTVLPPPKAKAIVGFILIGLALGAGVALSILFPPALLFIAAGAALTYGAGLLAIKTSAWWQNFKSQHSTAAKILSWLGIGLGIILALACPPLLILGKLGIITLPFFAVTQAPFYTVITAASTTFVAGAITIGVAVRDLKNINVASSAHTPASQTKHNVITIDVHQNTTQSNFLTATTAASTTFVAGATTIGVAVCDLKNTNVTSSAHTPASQTSHDVVTSDEHQNTTPSNSPNGSPRNGNITLP